MSWLQSYTGSCFDYDNPTPDMVHIEDIAHALSNLCRYCGHSDQFYSVALHSVQVSDVLLPECGIKVALIGLLHDATEAYLNDIPSPLKRLLPDYQAKEQQVWQVIADKFGLPYELPKEVKVADMRMLATEARDLLKPPTKSWGLPDWAIPYDFKCSLLPRQVVKSMFLRRFDNLLKQQ